MSSATLYRLSGIALLVGGTLGVIGYLIGSLPGDPTNPAFINSAPVFISNLLVYLGSVLLLGVPGMIARLIPQSKVLGLIGGVALFFVNVIFGVSNGFINLTIYPDLIANPATRAFASGPTPVMGVFFNVGMVLAVLGGPTLGIAILRARVLPRWTGVLLIVGTVAEVTTFLPIPFLESLAPILESIAVIGIGYALISPQRAPVAQPASATPATQF